ncbi:putative nuclease HARBI1 [Rana temporaria]|uniref:putative nuclease HARBI1 n=1 Tax=Rana temporaria TaxID=8407 RepID=UPI001AAD8D38|nr:putative nuclease HARBI1 [Rana temporaria]
MLQAPDRRRRLRAMQMYGSGLVALDLDPAMNRQLLALVSPYITRQDTVMREAISAEQRLVATLRYLATGRSLQDLKFSTGISPQALGLIIPDTCSAIIQVLQDDYMRLPSTPQEWQTVAAEFETRWNFPNCGGAIDGKHVRIVPPPRSGSEFYNYKGFNSIVLMAVVSAQYEFLYVDVGKNGRMSDGGAFRQTEFGERLQDEDLALPPDADNVEGLPFVFLADEAFGLGPHLMRPFPQRTLTPERSVFNYRLARARRVVENAFGIMASRFRLFLTSIHMAEYKWNYIVFACCILHNFLRRNSTNYMAMVGPEAGLNNPEQILLGLEPARTGLPPQSGRAVRDQYMEYFMGRGAIPSQANLA